MILEILKLVTGWIVSPFSTPESKKEIEVIHCWLCYSDASPIVTPFDNEGSVRYTKQHFECLTTFYRKGHNFGLAFFGAEVQTFQDMYLEISKKAIEDISTLYPLGNLHSPFSLWSLIKAGRLSFIESFALREFETDISRYQLPDPQQLVDHGMYVDTLSKKTRRERVEMDCEVMEVVLATLTRLKARATADIPTDFRDRLTGSWQGDREQLVVREFLSQKKKSEAYKETNWFNVENGPRP